MLAFICLWIKEDSALRVRLLSCKLFQIHSRIKNHLLYKIPEPRLDWILEFVMFISELVLMFLVC